MLICFLTFPTVENASGLSSRSVRTHNILFCYEPFWLDFKGLFASFLKEIQWTVMAKANAKARKKNWKKKKFIEFSIFPRKTEKLQFVSFFFSLVFFSGLETHTSIRPLKTNGDQRHNLVFVKNDRIFPLFFKLFGPPPPLNSRFRPQSAHHPPVTRLDGPQTRSRHSLIQKEH